MPRGKPQFQCFTHRGKQFFRYPKASGYRYQDGALSVGETFQHQERDLVALRWGAATPDGVWVASGLRNLTLAQDALLDDYLARQEVPSV